LAARAIKKIAGPGHEPKTARGAGYRSKFEG